MRIQKFQAGDMREALDQVKKALGADAVIVATREVRRGLLGKGVEVTAAIDAIDEKPEPLATAQTQQLAAGTRPTVATVTEADVERILMPLRSELRSLQTLLKPIMRGEIEGLRKQIADLGRQTNGGPTLEEAARAAITAPSRARTVALVGPTGVGKTTTIAKLAARAALVEQRRVAIVTLDDYRVGGEEQIRTFAELIGVPLHTVSGGQALAETLRALHKAERIFIDTAGRSPRDSEAIAALQETLDGADAEVHLVLPAYAPVAAVESTHARFRALAPKRLLFTKLDEGEGMSTIVHAPARLALPVSWIATGQRVPEDLEEATAERLLELARIGLAEVAA